MSDKADILDAIQKVIDLADEGMTALGDYGIYRPENGDTLMLTSKDGKRYRLTVEEDVPKGTKVNEQWVANFLSEKENVSQEGYNTLINGDTARFGLTWLAEYTNLVLGTAGKEPEYAILGYVTPNARAAIEKMNPLFPGYTTAMVRNLPVNTCTIPVFVGQPGTEIGYKDHVVREVVNQLTAVAKGHGQSQSIRDRLAQVVVPYLKGHTAVNKELNGEVK